MGCLWIFVAFLFAGRFVKGSEESGMVVTMMPRLLWWPSAKDLYMIPGTPYDLARNHTLYEDLDEFGLPSHMTSKLILQSCKADYSRKMLYMYDKGSAGIVAMSTMNWRNPSAIKIQEVHTGVSKGNVKVAVDWVSHNIYWTDPLFRWIAMQPGPVNLTDYSQDKSLYKIIIKDHLEQPYALAVDAVGGNLFWSDISKYPKVERASLTGAHRTQIISTGLKVPVAIDIDVSETDRRIYWVDSGRDTIESANLWGGERRIIRRLAHTTFYDLALFRDILSVVDRRLNTVHFINKSNGQETMDRYNRTRESIRGICMYHAEAQPARKDYCAEARCSDICVNELNQATCLCREGFKLHNNGYLCLEDTSTYHRALVVTDGSAIYLADIRSLAGNLTAYPLKNIYMSTVGEIKFMALDMVDRNIIFATDDEIYSVKIDVSNASAQHIVSSPNTITGLSIDWRDKKIYWSSGLLFGHISVVSQEGGKMYHLQTGLLHPRYLTVLALESKMVWLSGMFAPTIEISNLDGTAKTTVVGTDNLLVPKSLYFDSHTSRLYYIDRRNIKRIKINDTRLETIRPIAIAPNLVFVYQDYIVWTDDLSKNKSTIDTADVSKPGRTLSTSSFANVSAIQAIAVLDASLQPPQKGPCEADNGGCEHICIPLGRKRVCKCEHGYTTDDNGRTCSSVPFEDNFILVTDWSHNKIYQISLINDEVRAVDIQTAGNPNAVIYRPSDKRLIWADTKDKQVHSSYLNGSDHKMIVNAGIYGSFVDRLTIDSTSGNLYYTCVGSRFLGFDGVSVITPKGDSRDLVTRGYKLRDIVVDPKEGLMFWTDHGLVPSVKKANMDGTLVTDISPTTMEWPNGIAIDHKEKQLYISDGKLNTIQRCNYYGVCSVIHTDSGAHLMDIELSGQYLYYTAWNRPYITKMNKTSPGDITRIASNAELGRLDSLSVYRSVEEKPVNEKCLPNKGLGDCSTICLPTQSGRTCTCKDGVSLWPNSTICKDIPKCTSNIQDGAIIGTCTYLHLAACSFKCDRFHRPTTKDLKIHCENGKWDEPNPCVFSDIKCPATVANVLFESGCSYTNSETCTYNCTPHYAPSSKSETMTCDNGKWDNQRPCEKIAPDCPPEVDKVSFPDSCNFQNGEVCTYSCASGSVSTASNMFCTGSSWNIQTPCREPTTTTVTTTTLTSSSTADSIPWEDIVSDSSPLEDTVADSTPREDTVTPARLEGQSPVNIAAVAGGAAGGLILIIIIIVTICLIRKRYKRSGSADFTSPIYQDLDTVSSRISAPTESKKPESTYDLTVYDNFGGDYWYSDDQNRRNQNVYSC